MTEHSQREQHIRLCALRLRYRRAWQAQASSCRLAAMLTEIDMVCQRLASDSAGPDAECRRVVSAGAPDSVAGSGDVTHSPA
ncbi:hypothetical protein [Pantoea sp. S62]|uniref:hypothetical protein n=1 Tax=Pantoea sp. S62 TaxID=2769342 RepID=UPI0019136D83|nr:hypothetical protein [Pantoea sp. S62]MBK5017906.1 hypothetical protein [Pantoea sp. S62]